MVPAGRPGLSCSVVWMAVAGNAKTQPQRDTVPLVVVQTGHLVAKYTEVAIVVRLALLGLQGNAEAHPELLPTKSTGVSNKEIVDMAHQLLGVQHGVLGDQVDPSRNSRRCGLRRSVSRHLYIYYY